MKHIDKLARIVVFLGTVWLGTAAVAQTPLSDLSQGQSGVIQFSSTSPSITQLERKTAAPAITISGTLTFPAAVPGRVPAMVLAHSCSGVNRQTTDLAASLNAIGIATFIPDSFTPRGYPNGICGNSNVGLHGPAAADALNALRLLATHPNIDPNRIGIAGQSFGGLAVYLTAFEEVRTAIISGPLKFAAHVALYPGCEARNWSPNVTRAPILVLVGAADDWAPPGTCMDFDVLLRSYGAPVTTIVYPDAPHAWDSTGPVTYSAQRGSIANCRFEHRLDTFESRRFDSGEAISGTGLIEYFTACSTRGASAGRHEPTIAAATADITIFLARTFNLTGVAVPVSQSDRIFNFAEATYPSLFRPAGSASQTLSSYYYRYYPQSNSYLATSGGRLYYFAPAQSPVILEVGAEAPFLTQAVQAGY